ncbi:ATP-binding protein [Nitrospirillum sp. BR 11828]|uniref:ATP-binding protein n=1 Tax=Nitrospirillum sp. BR 11828 TaxID=3104325 RepID=UPI002ACAA650|nr:winged helix-turn-helix domain-containing protein [Nitrospirillum sp. BR 11828]MDZ5649608.1 winged helix-turn-helix domain-containing protein [Nitrospirillum sp. BR 11828]
MPAVATLAETVFRFGPFSLYPARRLLTAGQPIALRGRALDLLLALVERAGEVLSRAELEARVWPGLHVGENNLRVQMAQLRRALGQQGDDGPYVSTIPGQGYRFIAQVLRDGDGAAPPASPAVAAFALARQLAPPLGRGEVIAALAARLGRQRLVTIVGPGGMGKTTVALAIGAAVAERYPDGVALVDLSVLNDGALVPGVVAGRLAPQVQAANPVPALLAFLKPRRMLLILDSCETVTADAAALVEALLPAASGVDILATSREPLGLAAEHVHPLAPLAVPPRTRDGDAAQIWGHAAVRLFTERAAAVTGGDPLDGADARTVAEICRRLDGIPLGLELAAGQVAAYGVAGVALRLDDLGLLVRGRRTAAARHQTLRAAFDWSYTLLSGAQRAVLNRLSVFIGGFDQAAVAAVVSPRDLDGEGGSAQVLDELVAKSLVVADRRAGEARYRLLDTVRTYAREWLDASGLAAETRAAHATHYLRLFQAALPDWATTPPGDMMRRHGVEIDNVRQALDWCFRPAGSANRDAGVGDGVRMGRALILAVTPLWKCLSLWLECQRWVVRALASPVPFADDRQDLDLHVLRAMAATVTGDLAPPELERLWEDVLAAAARMGDADSRLQAQLGLYSVHFNQGHVRRALELALRMRDDAADSPDRSVPAMAERLVGAALYFLGDPAGARRHTEAALALADSGHSVRFQLDQQIMARSTLAGVLWVQGNVDQGLDLLRQSLQEAAAMDHAYTTCSVLGLAACPLAMLTSDLATARRHTDLLLMLADRHGLTAWQPWARCLDLILRLKAGGGPELLDELCRTMAALGDLSHARYAVLVRETALAMVKAGDLPGGLAMIDAALARAHANEEGWALPELARLRGLMLVRGGDPGGAEVLYRQALLQAEQQGAWTWRLRLAIDLAGLHLDTGLAPDAPAILAATYGHFTQGFGTADLRQARALLGRLNP